MKSIVFAACAAAATLCVTNSASAATELVTNGDFSTGDFTGWISYGVQSWTGIEDGYAFFGPFVDKPGGIAQGLATVAGTRYLLSFDLTLLSDRGAASHNFFDAILNGDTVISLVDAIAPKPTITYNYTFVASGPSLLDLRFGDDPQFWLLDNVSVRAVPEASTWAMMILGVGFAGAAMRGRRKVSAKLNFA